MTTPEKNLKEYLDRNPEAIKYQEEIEKRLDGLEDPNDRLLVLMKMLVENNTRLNGALKEFVEETRELVG